MEVGTAIDIYTTVLGWTLYDRLWEALVDTGLALLPFAVVIGRLFAEHWGEAGDAGADSSVRNLELDLIAMATVVALAGQPVLELKIGDLSHTAVCGAATVQGGATGTLYDSTFNLGGNPALVPVWWRAVMAVAAGFSNVAIAATPCDANLRRINYQIDNTRIADADLRAQLALFDQACHAPAAAKFARELRSLPAGYAADDTAWPGSKYFQDTAGFYSDPNPNLAPRAPTEIAGFPYDAARDADLDPPPASGLGRPTCVQWWTDASAGLRQRLLSQIDPQVLAAAENAAAGAASKEVVDNAQIRRLIEQDVKFQAPASSGSTLQRVADLFTPGNNLVPFLASAGALFKNLESQAEFYALQQAAPIAQSLVLMGIYLTLPFLLVFSGYSLEAVLLAGLGIFALRFLTALWALAVWVDSSMTKALGIHWWSGQSYSASVGILVAKMVGYLLYLGLPLVWFVVLGWAGHHLASSGLVGGLSEGIGKAAGGGIRSGAKLGTRAAGKIPVKK